MARDPRYDVLFEPVRLGPVTARNRFYQVPHCIGMGHRYPFAQAALRGMKAEGGWAVVCTEEAEIHHSSEISPAMEARIWDEQDIPALRLMTDAVHEHGGLAGIELVYNGHHAPNRYGRDKPMAPSHMPVDSYEPVQARAMDKQDIADFRRWHRDAGLRARDAGFDIVYAYSGHDMSLPMHFLSRRHNSRTDEYGGSLENRVRLFREMIEDLKDAVGGTCAVAVRLAVDELLGEEGIVAGEEGRDVVAMLAELPDLWDINIADWSNDSITARFSEEAFQEPYTAFVKSLTSKPVVGVGRFTSPDTMVAQIRRGVLDMIGAARPSIADPFLPKKIEEGRENEIRECIGCNICVASDNIIAPIRCTQNPTMGEEWRRSWHPEKAPPVETPSRVLVVGGGPAGLECARALALRGCEVTLAEADTRLGGRITREASLPGLSSWGRVRDYREARLNETAHADVYLDSQLDAEHVLEFGCPHVVIATGSFWRADAVGRSLKTPLPGLSADRVLTPDTLLADDKSDDRLPQGGIVVFDDDHYYMGGVLAERLARSGRQVTLVTPASEVSAWTEHTLEQARIQSRLIQLGVRILQQRTLHRMLPDGLEIACVYSGRTETIDCERLVPVTARLPDRALFDELQTRRGDWEAAGVHQVTLVGDALAPGTIAAAVYDGHRYAREFDAPPDRDRAPFRREMPWYGGSFPLWSAGPGRSDHR